MNSRRDRNHLPNQQSRRLIAAVAAAPLLTACSGLRWHWTTGYEPERDFRGASDGLTLEDSWYTEAGFSGDVFPTRPAEDDATENARLRALILEERAEREPDEPGGNAEYILGGMALLGAVVFAIIKWRAAKNGGGEE